MNLIRNFIQRVPADTRYNFGRDCIGNVYAGIFFGIYHAFVTIVARKYFHCSPIEISLLTAGGFIAGILGMLVSSFVPVNKENKYMAYMGFMGCAFIIFMAPFIKYNQHILYTVMGLGYFVCASFGPLYQVIVERIYRESLRAELLGYSKTLQALSSIILTALASLIIERNVYGLDMWRVCFVVGALACCGNMYFCFYKIRMPKVDIKPENPLSFLKLSFVLLKEDKTNTWLIVSGFFYTLAYMNTNTLVPIYQNDVLNIGPKEVAFLVLVQNIFWMIGYPIFGKFITQNGPVKGWILTCVLGIIMACGYIVCPVTNWRFLLFIYIFFGFFTAGNDLAWMTLILSLTGGKQVTKYQALHYFFMALRGFFGISVASFVIGYGEKIGIDYKWIFGVSIGSLIISLTLVCIIFRNYKK